MHVCLPEKGTFACERDYDDGDAMALGKPVIMAGFEAAVDYIDFGMVSADLTSAMGIGAPFAAHLELMGDPGLLVTT